MADAETPVKPRRHLPGDRRPDTRSMVRVDQAGEHGAARIYAGQLAVMGGRHPMAGEIRHMALQEQRHLDGMNRIMAQRGVRPTVLGPLWQKAAMACTEAVETVIDEHYGEQTDALADGSDPELKAMIDDYRADEVEHRDAAAAHTGGGAFPVLESLIKAGCRTAIAVAKRI
jgi:ubiquinone biosynthesis monooxygenase Coq7